MNVTQASLSLKPGWSSRSGTTSASLKMQNCSSSKHPKLRSLPPFVPTSLEFHFRVVGRSFPMTSVTIYQKFSMTLSRLFDVGICIIWSNWQPKASSTLFGDYRWMIDCLPMASSRLARRRRSFARCSSGIARFISTLCSPLVLI